METGETFSLKNIQNYISIGFSVAGMGMAGASLAKSEKSLKNLWEGEPITEIAAISNVTKKVSGESRVHGSTSLVSFVNAGIQLSSYFL